MIRLRSIFGDDIRIKRRLDYYDAGNGPIIFADGISGAGPMPLQTFFDDITQKAQTTDEGS